MFVLRERRIKVRFFAYPCVACARIGGYSSISGSRLVCRLLVERAPGTLSHIRCTRRWTLGACEIVWISDNSWDEANLFLHTLTFQGCPLATASYGRNFCHVSPHAQAWVRTPSCVFHLDKQFLQAAGFHRLRGCAWLGLCRILFGVLPPLRQKCNPGRCEFLPLAWVQTLILI